MTSCLRKPGIFLSRALLAAVMCGVVPGFAAAGDIPAPSKIAHRYSRSASWTSCKVLGSRNGQKTLPGLLARQWIIGYASGVLENDPEAPGAPIKGSDELMDEVRQFCQAHPNALALEAAESILPPALR